MFLKILVKLIKFLQWKRDKLKKRKKKSLRTINYKLFNQTENSVDDWAERKDLFF